MPSSTSRPLTGLDFGGPVWGYISLNEDKNTVYGVLFDHKGETPGLGAEITQPFSRSNSAERPFLKLLFKSHHGEKGGNATGAHEVTNLGRNITSKAVETMIADYLKCYEQFLKQIQ
ncbi:MAG: FMN-binding protein [Butyricimonas faecihominis]